MAGAPVDICNMALGMIASAPISAMTETSEEARVCTRFYDLVRRSTLMMHDWGCARVRLRLARPDNAAFFLEDRAKWSFSFLYPADCLKALRIERPGREGSDIPFDVAVEGGSRVILTNADHPVLEYTVDLTDTVAFSASFEQAFINRLASQMVLHLSMSSTIIRQIRQDAAMAVTAALAADAQEGHGPPRRLARWVDARGDQGFDAGARQ